MLQYLSCNFQTEHHPVRVLRFGSPSDVGNQPGEPVYTCTSARGKAVEMKLAALLLERGHEVAIPLNDSGVDLIVDYHLRVQVKSSGVKTRVVNGYHYPLCVWLKLRPDEVDVFALHAEYEGRDRWFIVPASKFPSGVVKTSTSVVLGEYVNAHNRDTISNRVRECENAWSHLCAA